MDVIVNFLANNYPWLLATLLICVAAVWITVIIVKRLDDIKSVKTDVKALKSTTNCKAHQADITSTKNDLGSIKTELSSFVANADCKAHHTDILSTKDDVKDIKNDIRSLLVGISNIKSAIVSIKPSTASLFANANSPLQLNEKGRKLFIASKADDVLKSNSSTWIEQLHEMGLKTALDVEEQSRFLLLGQINDDIFIPLKNYVYNHPVIDEVPVTMDDICFVMSLELRNLYLNAYPSILQDMPIYNR